jgi:monothiol glutaredoxin
MGQDVHASIAALVAEHPVVLFMKGSRRFPQCGFSSRVVSILDRLLPRYETVNVLSDPALRDGIKAFSQWPTIPQLYVHGKFVGGCDIVSEMAESGELATLLKDVAPAAGAASPGSPGAPAKAVAAPKITLTKAAADAFRGAAESDAELPRVAISAEFAYELYFDAKQPGDLTVSSEGLTLLIDPESARRADGLTIDFVGGESAGFKLDNPNEPPKVRALSPKDLQAMRQRGDAIAIFDVRTPAERTLAKVEGDRFLDDEGLEAVEALAKDAPMVFYCHHGHRSRSVAQHFVAKGFTRVYNLEGGIDAWARTVDPNVATY